MLENHQRTDHMPVGESDEISSVVGSCKRKTPVQLPKDRAKAVGVVALTKIYISRNHFHSIGSGKESQVLNMKELRFTDCHS